MLLGIYLGVIVVFTALLLLSKKARFFIEAEVGSDTEKLITIIFLWPLNAFTFIYMSLFVWLSENKFVIRANNAVYNWYIRYRR